MTHKHTWIEIGAYGHSSGDGTNRLMTVNEYCSSCGRVAESIQRANDATWVRRVKDEKVIIDDDGEVIASVAYYGV